MTVHVVVFLNRDPTLLAFARDLARIGLGHCHVYAGDDSPDSTGTLH